MSELVVLKKRSQLNVHIQSDSSSHKDLVLNHKQTLYDLCRYTLKTGRLYDVIMTSAVGKITLVKQQRPWTRDRMKNRNNSICLWTQDKTSHSIHWEEVPGSLTRSEWTTGVKSRRIFTSNIKDDLWTETEVTTSPVITWPKFRTYSRSCNDKWANSIHYWGPWKSIRSC